MYYKEDNQNLIRHLSNTLDAYPVGFQGNPLNLLFLEDANPIKSVKEYLHALDSPKLCEEQREYLITNGCDWFFPSVTINNPPDPWELSSILFDKFNEANNVIIRQSDIGRILEQSAINKDVDIVALMIVDGLSYYDLPDHTEAIPCLVDGVSITKFGFQAIIGKPAVSQLLFASGYRNQVGITYFDVESNEIAKDTYSLFGSSQLFRVVTFEECLEVLKKQNIERGYIQITAPGLEEICHIHHDVPPREEYLKRVLDRFANLVSCLDKNGRKVLACLTADHGILWRDKIDMKIPDKIFPENTVHPRYILGSYLRDFTHVKKIGGQTYSLMRVPYLTRPLRNTEWGVHGGISAWESIVPLIIRIIG